MRSITTQEMTEAFQKVSDAVVIVDELSKGRDAALTVGLNDALRRIKVLEDRLEKRGVPA